MTRFRAKNSRPAVSEMVGAVLTIAITLIAGAATWGFVQSQAGASEKALQTSNLTNSNFLNENFKVTDMDFPSTTQNTIWVYNVGGATLQIFSIRLYDSAGLINILYNYTVSSGVYTNRVFDLKAGASYYHSTCRMAGSSYETPTLSSTTVKTTNTQTFALTIPPTTANCPSYGQTFASGTTYTVVVTGVYGNVVTFYQTE